MKIDVAPLVGARIEMDMALHIQNLRQVAPLVGARIEIREYRGSLTEPGKSLPSWERGLKYTP